MHLINIGKLIFDAFTKLLLRRKKQMNINYKKKYLARDAKRFEEERARRILQLFFPDEFYDSVLDERPDIICQKNSIGVEVTTSMVEEFCMKASKAQSIMWKSENELTENDKKNIASNEVSCEKIFNHDSYDCVGYTYWGNTHDLIATFRKKIVRLNKDGFKKFDDNRLFIFSWLSCDDEIAELIVYLRNTPNNIILEQYGCEIIFDVVYIFMEKSLKVITLKDVRTIRELIMDQHDMRNISEISFETIYNIKHKDFYG